MATQVSPGIKISEIDNTLSLGQVALLEGAIAGNFQWGPVEQVTTVSSEDELVKEFGKPDANTADFFFTASDFLAYSNALRVVRVTSNVALAATTGANTTTLVGAANCTFATNATHAFITSSNNVTALAPGMTVLLSNSTAGPIELTLSAFVNSTAYSTTSIPTAAITSGNAFAYGVTVKNSDHYDSTWATGQGGVGSWAAKYMGILGNSLKVETCAGANAFYQAVTKNVSDAQVFLTVASGTTVTVSANTTGILQVGDILTVNVGGFNERRSIVTFASNGTELTINTAFSTGLSSNAFSREWKYANLFTGAPGTSDYALQRGGSDDELHIVVVDEDGAVSGAAGTVLEQYSNLSKGVDARKETGGSNYYATVINKQSAYIWWMDHPTNGTLWGNPVAGTAFAKLTQIEARSLKGGMAGASIVSGDLYRGYDLLAEESVEASLILGASANTTVATYIINNCVSPKRYSMGFFSPNRADVVDNAGHEVTSIVAYRNALPSTSYAFLDSGWKQTYDKYNDVYRYVPLNGAVAGCCVLTDQVAESWFSPAGFSRGQIKNSIKLAWNPSQVERDDLYRLSINPVVSFPGQGTFLYGDKTLLSKPSAFDRINVRRLLIAIEKTVEQSAKQQLFEQNDSFTRAAFVNMVEPYLRSVRARRGISDYFIVCDETNNPGDAIDRNEFRADIYVKPIRSINFIQLNFISVRSDVSFTESITNLG